MANSHFIKTVFIFAWEVMFFHILVFYLLQITLPLSYNPFKFEI